MQLDQSEHFFMNGTIQSREHALKFESWINKYWRPRDCVDLLFVSEIYCPIMSNTSQTGIVAGDVRIILFSCYVM